jgi:hypothetical protein
MLWCAVVSRGVLCGRVVDPEIRKRGRDPYQVCVACGWVFFCVQPPPPAPSCRPPPLATPPFLPDQPPSFAPPLDHGVRSANGAPVNGGLLATRGSLGAVSAWEGYGSGDHVVRLFEGSGAMWTAVRVLAGGFGGPGCADGQLNQPFGLRFNHDGTGLAVADAWNGRLSLFRVEDGSFARHVATGLDDPMDVEECDGGWLVVSDTIEFVGGDVDVGRPRARLANFGFGDRKDSVCDPLALALVPGLGLVVRQHGGTAAPWAGSNSLPRPTPLPWLRVSRGVAWQCGEGYGSPQAPVHPEPSGRQDEALSVGCVHVCVWGGGGESPGGWWGVVVV